MSKQKPSICFSHKYNKLSQPEFDTVRWLDSIYVLGKVYPCYLVAQNAWHGHYPLGSFRITKLDICKLWMLYHDSFTERDADCSKEDYLKMMEGWYSKKPDWKGLNSEVQLIHLMRVPNE